MNESPEFDERAFLAAHRAITAAARPDADTQEAVRVLSVRTPPRHRARRRQWKPPIAELQTIQPQHAYDSDALIR